MSGKFEGHYDTIFYENCLSKKKKKKKKKLKNNNTYDVAPGDCFDPSFFLGLGWRGGGQFGVGDTSLSCN